MFVSIDANRPIYRQIYEGIRDRIMTSELPPGTRLPSTRALATELGVSRRTVLVAYEQLLAEGYIMGRVGSGTTVAPGLASTLRGFRKVGADGRGVRPTLRLSSFGQRLTRSGEPSGWTLPGRALRYDFRHPVPPVEEFPWGQWRRLTARCLRQASRGFLSYGPSEGYQPLRVAVAQYLLRSRGFSCDPSHIIIVNGSQQALDLTARVMIDPGTPIVIEEPQFPGARQVFAGAGARLLPVAVDSDGLDPTRLGPEAAAARLAYVTPSHQFPTGAVLPIERRLALLRWAERSGAWVVEDDYDSEYRFEGHPIAAIKSLDRGDRVIYIGTFSKLLFPALRLGYLVLPPVLVPSFAVAKFLADRHSPTVEQAVLAAFLGEGHFDRLLRRLRKRVAVRRAALLAALKEYCGDRVIASGTNAGLHVLLWLPDVPPARLPALVERAAAGGVGVFPASAFYITRPRRGGLVLAYASMSEEDIRAGIRQLSGCLPQRPRT